MRGIPYKSCLGQDRSGLLACLAALVAGAIDLSHEDSSPADHERQAISDDLASALRLDMRALWTPTLDFWTRLPKAALVEALQQACEMQGMAEADMTARSVSAAKIRKDDLAQRVDDAWRGHGYLPELLVTPLPAGALELRESGHLSGTTPVEKAGPTPASDDPAALSRSTVAAE